MLDLTTQFPDMLRRAEAEVRKFFPVTSKTGRQLRAENFRWINIGDAVRDDFAAQKKTKLRDGTLAAKLVADVTLIDDKHKVLDSRTGMIVLQVPHATASGTFIVDGKELQVVNQLRLRPGLYTRFTVSDDVETFVNTSAAGTYRVILERNKGKFYFRVGPSAHFPLTTVLRALGISDGEMVQSWGKPIYDATQERTADDAEVIKLLMKLRPNLKPMPASAQEARQLLGDFLRSKPLDPEVNNLTLGQPFERIDGRALLAASVKCLKLAKREVEADDPESLSFKSIHSVEDFISERLAKQIPGLQRAVAFKLDRAEKVTDVFHSGMMTEPVRLFFAASEFSRYADQNNPVEMANLSHLTTVMGEGGIGSTHAVRDEVRAVHPSHLGVLDPVRTPEGQAVGLTGSLALGAQKVGNRIMVPVADVRTGKRFSVTVEELERSVVAFPDQYDLTKTPPKPMHPKVKGRLRQVFREFSPAEVQFILPDVKLLLGPSTNIIPFLHSDDGNRAGMGDRHVEQTVPLLNPDKPLVQAKFGDRGYEELFGSQYLPTAPVDGVVTKIEKDFITIKGARKSVDVQLHHYYPLNSSTYIHDTPSVKVGDKVKLGDRLADNNFTRGGSLAMGANLRVAYVPWKGENFEDGVIISQSAAQKLTSVHKYDLRLDLDKTIKTGLGRLLAQFPDQSKLVQNRNAFDEAGVIKVGSTLNPNDLVVAAVREADYHADYDYARLHKSLSKRWSDVSIYWDGHTAAKVVDVIKTPTFTRVIVTTEEPAQIGDKMCFAPEHDLLTRSGWKAAADVTADDEVCTLNPVTQEIEYQAPTRVFRYDVVDEPMYDLRSQQISMLVTLNHRLYVNRRGRVGYELRSAGSVMGTRVRFKKDGLWRGATPPLFLGFPTTPLMRLLGFFLAEGNREKVDYRIVFHQIKPAGRTWFRNLCAVLGLRYVEQDTRFIVYHKALWTWLGETGGKSWQKRIPDAVLSFGPDALGALWEGVMVGDGSRTSSGSEIITTTSPVMRDQLQEVALKCGWSANWVEHDADHPIDTPYGRIAATGQIVMKRRRIFTVRLVKAKNRPQLNHGHVGRQNGQAEVITHYTGSVHCVEVPNHIVYTRRDGKPHWSGNSMRHGGKGIITSIMPDGEILHDAEGRPMDVLFNPAGLVGRVNPGQLLEAAAGKVSAKTGKTYLVENFSRDNKDAVGDVRRDLRMAGLDENSEESLTDPLTGRTYDRTMAGTMHFLKLRHSVSKKYTARGFGEQYTVDQAPAKTEEGSAQRIGGLELYALLAGDAKHYVNDAFTIKGQRNDEYWRAVQMGLPPPRPKTPFISEKFLTYMAGAGVDLKRDGDIIKASPMTDKTILAASNGAIQNALVIDAGTLKPEKGGLFDQALTGGPGGDHYNHIELPEPIVHPLMMPAAAAVAGISNKQLSGLIDGSYGYDAKGEVVVNDGKMPTGVPALAAQLAKIDVDKELKSLEVKINATQSLTLRDKLLKRRRYLLALQQLGMKPNEAYINNVISVIPAKFRAVYPLPDGSLNVADPVHGYREVMLVAEALKDLKALKVSDDKLGRVRTDLHAAIGGLVGTTEPLTRSAHFKGFLQQIKGLENKTGMFQGKVMTRPQDLSARSTIIPDPKLNLDDVGIPEDMALVIYRPFLIRRLKALGHQPLVARDMVEKKHPLALKALELEVKERPVLLNRAPSLHKFNVMAFRPRIVQGQAVMINPLIVKGYNADFDGDAQLNVVWIRVKTGDILWSQVLPDAILTGDHVTARFGVSLPLASGDRVAAVDLADFPRGEKLRTTQGEHGIINHYLVPEGVEVLAYDEQERRVTWRPATEWSEHLSRKVVTVTLKSGYQILTDEDPRAVYGVSAGSLVPMRCFPSQALELRMLVPRAAKLAETHTGGLATWAVPAAVHLQGGDQRRALNNHIALSAKVGHLLGVLIGNGWASNNSQVCLSDLQGETADAVDAALPCIFEQDVPVRGEVMRDGATGGGYGASRRHVWSSAAFCRLVEFLIGKGAHAKHLPSFFLMATRECRLGLLAGLIDTDGSVSVSHGKAKPQTLLNYSTVSERLAREIVLLSRSLGIKARITTSKTPAGAPCYVLNFTVTDAVAARLADEMVVTRKRDLLRSTNADAASPTAVAQDIVPITPETATAAMKALRARPDRDAGPTKSLYVTATKARSEGYVSRAAAERMMKFVDVDPTWRAVVLNRDVTWDLVESVEQTELVATGYDLTVPGFETFMSIDGVILSNTMGIHVPVTEDARKEALEKLLPSKNMLSPADNRVVHTPSNEMLLGIYLMTNPLGAPKPAKSELDIVAAYKAKKVQANTAFRIKNEVTCPGRVLFNEILPEPLRIHEPVTSKLLSKIIDAVAKKYEPQAPEILSKLKDMGNHYVTEIGFSVSLRDLVIDKTQRDVIMSDARARTKDVGFAQASMEAVKKLDAFVHSPQNSGNRMVQLTSISGALGGKSAQVTRMLGAPVAVMDHHGVPVPVQINKSYAEGFDLGSYWATMPGVRKGMMDKGLSTADTGYLTKLLVQANIENVISEADCGATDGVLMQADDSDLIGRYIANGKDAGHPVTPEMQRRLQTAGASILVRSALKCRSGRGVCQKCFGNSENGKPYPVGYHLGVLAAQTVGEPSTQLSLRTFHSGGSIGGRSAAGFPRVKQLYHLPENVTGRSILALEAGVVGPIMAAPAGGWMVTVGTRSHYVPQELGLKVKVGQRVAAGDQISLHGVLRPQDLLDATGDVDRTRAAMINDLSDSFKGSGVNIKRRIFETTVKPMTDKAEVSDPGDGYILGVVAGDVLPIVKLEAMNQKLINKIKFTPLLLGVVQVPHRGGDFIGRLMHERIVDTVRNAASRGQTSDIGPNGHPVASLALRNVQTPIGMPDRRKR